MVKGPLLDHNPPNVHHDALSMFKESTVPTTVDTLNTYSLSPSHGQGLEDLQSRLRQPLSHGTAQSRIAAAHDHLKMTIQEN